MKKLLWIMMLIVLCSFAFANPNDLTSGIVECWEKGELAGVTGSHTGTNSGVSIVTGFDGVNDAWDFESTENDIIYVDDSNDFKNVNFSVVAVVKVESFPDNGMAIIDYERYPNAGDSFGHGYTTAIRSGGNEYPFFILGDGTANRASVTTSGNQLSAGQWYTLGWTYNDSNNKAITYINGSQNAEGTFGGGTLAFDQSDKLGIGRYYEVNFQTSTAFDGIIDRLCLYNETKSATAMETYYNDNDPLYYEDFFSNNESLWINKIPIDCSEIIDGTPIVVNGSSGWNDEIIWTQCQSDLYLYWNSTSNYIIGNATDKVPYEVESGLGTSFVPTSVWPSDYEGVWNQADLTDSTSNSNDMTNSGSAQVSGMIDGAYYYDGGDYQMVTSPSAGLKFTNNFTIDMIINSTEQNYAIMFSQTADPNGGQGTGFLIYNFDASGIIYFQKSTGASSYERVDSQGDIMDGGVYYLRVVQSDTTGMELFINGVSVDTDPGTTDVYYDATAQYLDLGDVNNDGSHGSYFDGIIDNVRVVSGVLTDANATYQNYLGTEGFGSLGENEELIPWLYDAYNYRMNISCSDVELGLQIVINGSDGFEIDGNQQIVWTICNTTSMALYYNNETDYFVANGNGLIPYEVERGNQTSYLASSVWYNYGAVQHYTTLEDSTGNYVDATTSADYNANGIIAGDYNYVANNDETDTNVPSLSYLKDDTSDWSVEVCFTPDIVNSNDGLWGNTATSNNGISCIVKDSFYQCWYDGYHNSGVTMVADTTYCAYHSFADSNNNHSMFINGNLEYHDQGSWTDPSASDIVVGNFYVGRTTERFDGDIDEWRIKLSQITEEQAYDKYQNYLGTTDYGSLSAQESQAPAGDIIVNITEINCTSPVPDDTTEPFWTNDDTPTYSITTDYSAGCKINGSWCATTNATHHVCTQPSALDEGLVDIYLSCNSTTGNVSTFSYQNYIDTINPNGTITSPTASQQYNQSSLTAITISVVFEDRTDVNNISCLINGTTNATNSSPINNTVWNWEFTPSAFTDYVVDCYAWDNVSTYNQGSTGLTAFSFFYTLKSANLTYGTNISGMYFYPNLSNYNISSGTITELNDAVENQTEKNYYISVCHNGTVNGSLVGWVNETSTTHQIKCATSYTGTKINMSTSNSTFNSSFIVDSCNSIWCWLDWNNASSGYLFTDYWEVG